MTLTKGWGERTCGTSHYLFFIPSNKLSLHTVLLHFLHAQPEHVRVEISNSCFPRELVSFDPWHVSCSPPIGIKHNIIWVRWCNKSFCAMRGSKQCLKQLYTSNSVICCVGCKVCSLGALTSKSCWVEWWCWSLFFKSLPWLHNMICCESFFYAHQVFPKIWLRQRMILKWTLTYVSRTISIESLLSSDQQPPTITELTSMPL